MKTQTKPTTAQTTRTRTPRVVTQLKRAIKNTERELARYGKQIIKYEEAIAAIEQPANLARKMYAVAEESMASLRAQLDGALTASSKQNNGAGEV